MEIKMKNIKKISGALMLMLALCTFYACDGGEGEVSDGFTMKATVRAVREKIEVDVTEAEYASGIYDIIISDVTRIFDADGNEVDRSAITEGKKLLITYNGQTMLSLPPQVVARKIIIV
jgi:uncharacterized protein YycO